METVLQCIVFDHCRYYFQRSNWLEVKINLRNSSFSQFVLKFKTNLSTSTRELLCWSNDTVSCCIAQVKKYLYCYRVDQIQTTNVLLHSHFHSPFNRLAGIHVPVNCFKWRRTSFLSFQSHVSLLEPRLSPHVTNYSSFVRRSSVHLRSRYTPLFTHSLTSLNSSKPQCTSSLKPRNPRHLLKELQFVFLVKVRLVSVQNCWPI